MKTGILIGIGVGLTLATIGIKIVLALPPSPFVR